jgi:hypothetical protein
MDQRLGTAPRGAPQKEQDGSKRHGYWCRQCGHQLTRVRRTFLQKLIYSDAWYCRRCHRQTTHLYLALATHLQHCSSRYTRCVRCAGLNVRRLRRRDRSDPLSKHPISLLLGWVGAPLNMCDRCRLQYFDWRPIQRASLSSRPQSLGVNGRNQ